MKILRTLEQKFGRFAIPNVTAVLIAGQVAVYLILLLQIDPGLLGRVLLIPERVLEGELWRLLSFLFQPPAVADPSAPLGPIFAFFFWYLFYIMGTALEQTWGTLRYNLYLLVGYVANLAVAFLQPEAAATNIFLEASVFLAFAQLYPDFQLYLFLLLPIKIKWLALLAWIGYGWAFLFGGWMVRLLILASVANFLLFFTKDIWNRIKSGRRRANWQSRQSGSKQKAFHRCEVCGITDVTHPDMTFRYCSQCSGARGYCTEHINNHEHITSEQPSNK